MHRPDSHAFSLVELSIVLVILGLLVGGILAGQSLIRASEVRAVITEHQRYLTAAHAFRDKYFYLPGDFRDATRIWGRQVNAAHCVTNSAAAVAASGGVCDGNGNGVLGAAAAASESGDMFQFWRHLASAGLIEGTYSGLAGAGTVYAGGHTIIGTNAPASRLANAGWMNQGLTTAGNGIIYQALYENTLIFGGTITDSINYGAVLKPEEAWNIDTKMDDGMPGRGKVLAANWDNAATPSCTTSTTNTDYSGTYKLTNTAIACSLYFPRAL